MKLWGRRSGRDQNIENNPMQSSRRRPALDQATWRVGQLRDILL